LILNKGETAAPEKDAHQKKRRGDELPAGKRLNTTKEAGTGTATSPKGKKGTTDRFLGKIKKTPPITKYFE